MADDRMNELLEEAAAKAKDLSEEASDWIDALKKMLDKAGDLSERLGDEGREASAHLNVLTTKLEQAAGKLESAAKGAGSELDDLGQKAENLETDIGELVERVKKDLDELEEQKGRIRDSVDTQFHSMGSEVSELGQQILEREAATNQHLADAQKSIGEFRQFVEKARGELAQKQAQWVGGLSEVWSEADKRTQAWVNALSGVLADQTTAMVEMANHMIGKHNEVMEGLKQKFAVQAKNEVANSLDPLRVALEAVRDLCDDYKDDFGERSQQILDRIGKAMPLIADISVSLQTAHEMLNL